MGVLQPGNRRALLGELRMPIETEIKHALPFDRVSNGEGTTCGFFCHQNEELDPRIRIAEAFVSKSIRAAASSEVTLDFLRGRTFALQVADRERALRTAARVAGDGPRAARGLSR